MSIAVSSDRGRGGKRERGVHRPRPVQAPGRRPRARAERAPARRRRRSAARRARSASSSAPISSSAGTQATVEASAGSAIRAPRPRNSSAASAVSATQIITLTPSTGWRRGVIVLEPVARGRRRRLASPSGSSRSGGRSSRPAPRSRSDRGSSAPGRCSARSRRAGSRARRGRPSKPSPAIPIESSRPTGGGRSSAIRMSPGSWAAISPGTSSGSASRIVRPGTAAVVAVGVGASTRPSESTPSSAGSPVLEPAVTGTPASRSSSPSRPGTISAGRVGGALERLVPLVRGAPCEPSTYSGGTGSG